MVEAAAIDSSVIRMGIPARGQLNKIRRFQLAGTKPLEAEEVYTVSFMASNNLIRRPMTAWSLPVLAQMYKRAPGSTLLLNHNPETPLRGRIYDARFTVNQSPPYALLDEIGYGKENRKLIKDQGGLYQVWMDAYLPRSPEAEQLMEDMRTGVAGEVSTGGIIMNFVERCDACNCQSQQGIWGGQCQKLHPGIPWEWFYDEDEMEEIRPRISRYTVFDGDDYDSIELSLTPSPAVGEARAPRQGEADVEMNLSITAAA